MRFFLGSVRYLILVMLDGLRDHIAEMHGLSVEKLAIFLRGQLDLTVWSFWK